MSGEPPFPEPDAGAGWPCLQGAADVRDRAGMHDRRVYDALADEAGAAAGHAFALVVVRHGLLVRELASFNVSHQKRFDVWSCTKSFTAIAWGLLLAERPELALETPIYELIPDAGPLSDPRKARITVGHVLSMTSGIPGETRGIAGMPTVAGRGIFEYALGHAPNRLSQWVGELAAEPGEAWDYSDPAFAHLALAFAGAAGAELADVLGERVLRPIGVRAAWDVQGGGGFRGPHTNAHTGLHVSARDLARFGYLLLHGGAWQGRQLVPRGWIETVTRPSQGLNPGYGLGFWTNGGGAWTPGLPSDLFALAGFCGNRCYVVPSADLVVARVATGPLAWHESRLLSALLGAIL